MPGTEANQPWQATRRGIAEAMGQIDAALPGSVVVRHMRCGKPGCACKAEPPTLHGPYIQWTRTVDGKTVHRGRQDRHQVPQRRPTRPLPTVVRQRPTPQGTHRDAPHRLGARRRNIRRMGHTGRERLIIATPTPIAARHPPIAHRQRVPPAEPRQVEVALHGLTSAADVWKSVHPIIRWSPGHLAPESRGSITRAARNWWRNTAAMGPARSRSPGLEGRPHLVQWITACRTSGTRLL